MTLEQLKEAFYEQYTDDSVNWLKFLAVFVALIAGYVIIFPLYKKVSYFLSRERKMDMAMSKGNHIQASLVKYYVSGTGNDKNCHATYEYELNGETKKYKAMFIDTRHAPRMLTLYYVDNPKKMFSMEEYRWENHKGVVLLAIQALPWLLAIATLMLLKPDISGFG